jgi:diguanylate cyclase (GGDEF)-like protein
MDIREDAGLLRTSHGGRELAAITLSLGVAMFPEHGTEAAALVKQADVALYEAKYRGRNCVILSAAEVSSPG